MTASAIAINPKARGAAVLISQTSIGCRWLVVGGWLRAAATIREGPRHDIVKSLYLSAAMTTEALKPVIWVGSSLGDLREFPEPVQDHIGYALYVAQRGGKHRDTKTLTGIGGAGVVEVVKDYRGDTFRVVYTVRFA